MTETGDAERRLAEKADRRAARALIAAYHQAELRTLLEHVRAGFTQLDAGDIDEFELDDVIHHYKRSRCRALEVLRVERRGVAPGCERAHLSARAGRGAKLVGAGHSASHQIVLTGSWSRPRITGKRPTMPVSRGRAR
jgi:hypothetical protein